MEYNGYLIAPDRTFGYYNIKPVGKGSVPKALHGGFTKAALAQRAIDEYQATPKVTKNGKDSIAD